MKIKSPFSILFIFVFSSLSSLAQHEKFITQQEVEVFKSAALDKVKELEKYIITITDKSVSDNLKSNTIDLAVKLFQDDDKLVEVSSINKSDIRSFPIRQYLNRVKVLPYSKVIISWYNISYISDFVRDPSGNYQAVITIFQKFEGYIDGKLVYKDVAQKNIGIVIKDEARYFGDRKVETRQVLLGDIRVIETRQN